MLRGTRVSFPITVFPNDERASYDSEYWSVNVRTRRVGFYIYVLVCFGGVEGCWSTF